jgi:hypothetical protein
LEELLTQSQILEWMAYYRIRPFGGRRDDLRAGLVSFWNVACHVTEPPEDHTPEKYTLSFNDGPPLTEAEEILKRIRSRMSGEQ